MSDAVSDPTTVPVTVGDPDPYRPRTKTDLWICWTAIPVFFMMFGCVFVVLTRLMPPPSPNRTTAQIVDFVGDHRLTIQIGFAVLLATVGVSGVMNGLIAYQMRRMAVSPAFAYSYIGSMAIGAVSGFLIAAFCFLAATFRPDRDPQLIVLLYDVGLLSFFASLGCFSTQYLVLALAIFWDRNQILPKWLAYVCIWQSVTQLLGLGVYIFKTGPFAWNGTINFWLATAIFAVFQTCMIILLRTAIQRQPLGEQVTP